MGSQGKSHLLVLLCHPVLFSLAMDITALFYFLNSYGLPSIGQILHPSCILWSHYSGSEVFPSVSLQVSCLGPGDLQDLIFPLGTCLICWYMNISRTTGPQIRASPRKPRHAPSHSVISHSLHLCAFLNPLYPSSRSPYPTPAAMINPLLRNSPAVKGHFWPYRVHALLSSIPRWSLAYYWAGWGGGKWGSKNTVECKFTFEAGIPEKTALR